MKRRENCKKKEKVKKECKRLNTKFEKKKERNWNKKGGKSERGV